MDIDWLAANALAYITNSQSGIPSLHKSFVRKISCPPRWKKGKKYIVWHSYQLPGAIYHQHASTRPQSHDKDNKIPDASDIPERLSLSSTVDVGWRVCWLGDNLRRSCSRALCRAGRSGTPKKKSMGKKSRKKAPPFFPLISRSTTEQGGIEAVDLPANFLQPLNEVEKRDSCRFKTLRPATPL